MNAHIASLICYAGTVGNFALDQEGVAHGRLGGKYKHTTEIWFHYALQSPQGRAGRTY